MQRTQGTQVEYVKIAHSVTTFMLQWRIFDAQPPSSCDSVGQHSDSFLDLTIHVFQNIKIAFLFGLKTTALTSITHERRAQISVSVWNFAKLQRQSNYI